LTNEFKDQGFEINLTGIGTDPYSFGLSNWTEGNDASVCIDYEPFDVWDNFGASQRDLFVFNSYSELIFHENITNGIPNELELIIMDLMSINNLNEDMPDFRISSNFPNPFNSNTQVDYELLTDMNVIFQVYNIKGQLVRSLVNEFQTPGKKSILWNGKNDLQERVSSGIYFLVASINEQIQSKKMVLVE